MDNDINKELKIVVYVAFISFSSFFSIAFLMGDYVSSIVILIYVLVFNLYLQNENFRNIANRYF